MTEHTSAGADLSRVRNLLLDMDGTLYLGARVFGATSGFLAGLQHRGLKYLLLTNNSSLDAVGYAAKLARMGLTVPAERIFTSGEATTIYLAQTHGPSLRLFVLGTATFEAEMARAGFTLVDEGADCVVVGFDNTLTYDKVRRACREIRRGAAFVASHPDLVCPTEEGPIPDAGSMAAMITSATGVTPTAVGKPSTLMVRTALARLGGAEPAETAMVGDRLYTDMRMALEGGLTAILVLTGEAQEADLADTPYPPHHVFPSIAQLAAALGIPLEGVKD